MKVKQNLLSCLFIFPLLLAAQVERVKIEHEDGPCFPQIGGYYTDEIPIEKLSDPGGLQCNAVTRIVSFTMSYPRGTEFRSSTFQGNAIPDSIILDITRFALGEQVFITDIKALKPDGLFYVLPSMRLIPILKDE